MKDATLAVKAIGLLLVAFTLPLLPFIGVGLLHAALPEVPWHWIILMLIACPFMATAIIKGVVTPWFQRSLDKLSPEDSDD